MIPDSINIKILLEFKSSFLMTALSPLDMSVGCQISNIQHIKCYYQKE